MGLVRPPGDPKEMLDSKLRPHALGESLRLTLDRAYEAYARHCPTFDSTFTPHDLVLDDAGVLRALYRRCRATLRERAFAAQPLSSYGRFQCQLCGLSEANTLDHYLGQAQYPEYAIHPWNVIPTCSKCNWSRATFGIDGQRRVLHLYEDDLLAVSQMVTAEVFKNGQDWFARYFLASPSKSSLDTLFYRQWDVLDLGRRFELRAPSKLEEIRMALSCGDDLSSIRSTLGQQAKSMEFHRGVNDWEVALYRGAARSDQFLKECITV